MLRGVARSFALTLGQLPRSLRKAAGNAYLLCRIADTIEDDPMLSNQAKERYLSQWVDVVAGSSAPREFAATVGRELTTSASARELVSSSECVVAIMRTLSAAQQKALLECLRTMTRGMVEFQHHASRQGLKDLQQFDRYCYHVAGVVGEMLTELFCDYSKGARKKRDELMALSTSFGQALQMTNVLKDVWDDYRRGVCWLPRDVFAKAGIHDLRTLKPGQRRAAFEAGMATMLAIAAGQCRNAVRYILLLPWYEAGVRRACLWPLVLAIATLQRIRRTPHFTTGQEVKVSRSEMWMRISTASGNVHSNTGLRMHFKWLMRGLEAQ